MSFQKKIDYNSRLQINYQNRTYWDSFRSHAEWKFYSLCLDNRYEQMRQASLLYLHHAVAALLLKQGVFDS